MSLQDDIRALTRGAEAALAAGDTARAQQYRAGLERLLAQAREPQREVSRGRAAVSSLGQGLLAGFGDEAFGALRAFGDIARDGSDQSFGDLYRQYRDDERDVRDAARRQFPLQSTGIEFGSAFAPGFGIARGVTRLGTPLLRGANLARRPITRLAAGGAAAGAVGGAGDSDQEGLAGRASDAARGALTGAAIGTVLPFTGQAITDVAQGIRRRLGASSGQLTQEVEDLARQAARRRLDAVRQAQGYSGIDDVQRALREIGGDDIRLYDLPAFQRLANETVTSPGGRAAGLGRSILERQERSFAEMSDQLRNRAGRNLMEEASSLPANTAAVRLELQDRVSSLSGRAKKLAQRELRAFNQGRNATPRNLSELEIRMPAMSPTERDAVVAGLYARTADDLSTKTATGDFLAKLRDTDAGRRTLRLMLGEEGAEEFQRIAEAHARKTATVRNVIGDEKAAEYIRSANDLDALMQIAGGALQVSVFQIPGMGFVLRRLGNSAARIAQRADELKQKHIAELLNTRGGEAFDPRMFQREPLQLGPLVASGSMAAALETPQLFLTSGTGQADEQPAR